MKTHGRLRSSILVAICTLALTLTSFAGDEHASVAVGSKVGSFTLVDTQGKTHNISDFKGKIVVFEWANPHCPVSERMYTQNIMQELQKKYTEKGVVWVTINSTNADHQDYESAEGMNRMYADWKGSATALCIDTDGEIGRLFHAKTTPHMFVIDQTQTLAYAGAVDDDPRGNKTDKVNYVANALDELLEGKSVTTSTTAPYGCSVKYKK